jgi:hypothetical protein
MIALLAKKTLSAGDNEGHYYTVAFFEFCYLGATFFHYAHKFMAHYHVFYLWKKTIINVKVGAQMAVEVTRKRISSGCSMMGLSTLSTLISPIL